VSDGSFSRASASLRLAQPAISRRIALLETELGVPLFVRGKRRVTLTEAGQALLPYATRCLQLVDEGCQAAGAVKNLLRLTLAAPSSIAPHVFAPVITALEDASMEVSCRTAHTAEVIQMLLDGVIDAGFLLAGPTQAGLRLRLLHRDPVFCVAAKDHPLASCGSLHVRDLVMHRIALFTWGPDCLILMELLQNCGLPRRGRREVTPAVVARDLVLGHGYVSFLPSLTIAEDLRNASMVSLEICDLPHWTWDIAVAYRERQESDRAVSHLLAALDGMHWAQLDTGGRKPQRGSFLRRKTAARLARRPVPAPTGRSRG
jgi:DNA-binding transcriptional LysR family regulator